jgi:chloramphenicol 3-O-phosphotransferase
VRVLRDLPVLFVGVRCPVPVLEQRELARGDRDVGQARRPSSRVHGHGAYDVEVDTHASSVETCADTVRSGLPRSGGAFEALRHRFVERS